MSTELSHEWTIKRILYPQEKVIKVCKHCQVMYRFENKNFLCSATATNPANPGGNGYGNFFGLNYFYGGTGGASTHGTATGGGLVQAAGGNGAIGCGGGGMGGALTGSTAATASKGGDSRLWIYGW